MARASDSCILFSHSAFRLATFPRVSLFPRFFFLFILNPRGHFYQGCVGGTGEGAAASGSARNYPILKIVTVRKNVRAS